MRIFLYVAATVIVVGAGVIGVLTERLNTATAEANYLRLQLRDDLGLAELREEELQIHRALHDTENDYIRALRDRLEQAALRTYIRRVNPRARARQIAESIQTCAQRYEVEPQLVLGVMQQESSFNHLAVGHAGERGLMQLTLTTARELEVNWSKAFDIRTNVCAGARYLADLVARYGDSQKAALHYNGGGDPLYTTRVSRHLLRIAGEFDPRRTSFLTRLAQMDVEKGGVATDH